jgi:hypothetical protein
MMRTSMMRIACGAAAGAAVTALGLLNSDAVIPVRTATNTIGTPIQVKGNNTAIAMIPAGTACCR